MSLDVTLTEQHCSHCGAGKVVFEANITHNLNKMAAEGGVYEHIWRPEELNIKLAKDLIKPLQQFVDDMKKDPARFKEFNTPNGWGTYVNFLPWCDRYLQACIKFPDATISVCR